MAHVIVEAASRNLQSRSSRLETGQSWCCLSRLEVSTGTTAFLWSQLLVYLGWLNESDPSFGEYQFYSKSIDLNINLFQKILLQSHVENVWPIMWYDHVLAKLMYKIKHQKSNPCQLGTHTYLVKLYFNSK